MAEFLERQAEESSGEDDDYEPISKKKRPDKRSRLSDEDDEEDEEDDENEIRKEMKGFVVENDDDDDVEAEADKSDFDDKDEDEDEDLEEEDMELIRSNLDIEPAKKERRLVMEDSDDETDRERIQRNLFDQDAAIGEVDEESVAKQQREAGSSDSGESEEEDNFIVDDEMEKPSRRPKHRRMDIPEHALTEARDVFGVDDFNFDEFYEDEDEEYPEDEGDEGEGEEVRRLRRMKRGQKKRCTLLDEIEPAELERGFLADFDKQIQLQDRPERFQLRRFPVTDAEDIELKIEADWIYLNAFQTQTVSMQDDLGESTGDKSNPEKVKMKILEALRFIRNQQFEVPFIAFYRKEYVEPELGINDLWKIYQYDEKFNLLQLRMQRLLQIMTRMKNYLDSRWSANREEQLPDDLRMIEQHEIDRVLEVSSVEQLTDILDQFRHYYGSQLSRMVQWEKVKSLNNSTAADEDAALVPFKQATKNDPYQLCIQNGLSGLAAKFGLTAGQFAENVKEKYPKHEVEQYPVDPRETAQDYVSKNLDVEAVLRGAKFIVAKQFSREPDIRKEFRERFKHLASVSTVPTKKGRSEIDENHAMFTRKYLKCKPVGELEKDEFLTLMQANDNGLIQLRFGLLAENESIMAHFKHYYHRDEYSSHVIEWNNVRADVLKICEEEILLPFFEKEFRQKLLQEARDYVIRECCQKLYAQLKVGPYDADMDDEKVPDGVRVLGIAFPVEREQASFCALIDGQGEVVDHMRLVHLTKRKNSNRKDDVRLKEQDLQDLKRFVLRLRPHVIALSGENLDALSIKRDIETTLNELLDSAHLHKPVPVEIVDNELAKVFMDSKRAQTDFRDYPVVLRQAISLARRLQDPLPEFCQMCTPDEEILCLTYHPFQNMVRKEELMLALNLEFINRVNEVGVDMNRCLEHPHTMSLLQFVCGLGPRKAVQLVKILKLNDNLLESRTKLVTLCRMGPKVFMNCAGFIKIDTVKVSERTDSYVEVLDGSRVHPETYEWARKMAVDALEIEESGDDGNPTSALEEILDSPDRLKDLDLDAFADELHRQGFGNKSITLYDIRAELNCPYKDLRSAYKTPTREDLFNMLTKETPQTFNVGKLVMGRVMYVVHRKPRSDDNDKQPHPVRDDVTGKWTCPWCHQSDFIDLGDVWSHLDNQVCPGQAVGVKVRLENGITGFIPNKYLSDKAESFIHPSERVKPHFPIYCRVLKVDTDRFQAELSSRTSDLTDRDHQFRPPKDRYYDFNLEMTDLEEEKKAVCAKKSKKAYVKRVIAHPSFHNITFKDAERMLQSFDQGEAIIRPSSKGFDKLTVTWKVADGIYQHIDVQEENKENEYSLGRNLKINEEDFEDLDEIIARHVQPMAAYARDIMSYKYYLDGKEARNLSFVEEHLNDEKQRQPSRIPYALTASGEYPGKFILSYMPRVRPRHEAITVTSEGFRFRQQIFSSLTALFKWFKEHFRDPLPGNTMSTRQRNNNTPFESRSMYGEGTNFDAVSRVSSNRHALLMPPPPPLPMATNWHREPLVTMPTIDDLDGDKSLHRQRDWHWNNEPREGRRPRPFYN